MTNRQERESREWARLCVTVNPANAHLDPGEGKYSLRGQCGDPRYEQETALPAAHRYWDVGRRCGIRPSTKLRARQLVG